MPTIEFGSKDYYVLTWKRMLGALLHWSEDRVEQWMRDTGKDKFLQDEDDLIFHESPQYWACSAILQARIPRRLSSLERAELRASLVELFNDDHYYRFPLDHDWAQYRDDMDRVLNEFMNRMTVEARSLAAASS